MTCSNKEIPGYNNFIKLLKDKCNVNNYPIDSHKDFKQVWKHAYMEGKNLPIEQHRDYLTIMNKYAIKGKDKCGFLPCKNIQNHPEYEQERERLLKEWQGQDISKHPGYQALMEKYAIRGPNFVNGTGNGCSNGITGYIPCKDITRHPLYEQERQKWLREWNKMPIYRHPQYRESVEKLLKNLLERLGQDAKNTLNNQDFNELVNMCGGSSDIIEMFSNPNFDKSVSALYDQVVNNQTKPCPPPSIKLHPDYKKLVDMITSKVSLEFGCNTEGCNGAGAKRCSEYLPIVKKEEKKLCQDKLNEAKKVCDSEKKEMEDHWKRLHKKLNDKCQEDKDALNNELKKTKSQLECCKRQYNKCKNMPITEHPDYEQVIKKEQLRLLEMIKQEQGKCRVSEPYKTIQLGGEGDGKKKNLFVMN